MWIVRSSSHIPPRRVTPYTSREFTSNWTLLSKTVISHHQQYSSPKSLIFSLFPYARIIILVWEPPFHSRETTFVNHSLTSTQLTRARFHISTQTKKNIKSSKSGAQLLHSSTSASFSDLSCDHHQMLSVSFARCLPILQVHITHFMISPLIFSPLIFSPLSAPLCSL